MNTAPLAVDSSYIVRCVSVKEADGRVKTVITTAEPVNYMSLTDAAGNNYGECHNFCEPFAFLDHIFYLPEGTKLEKPILIDPITAKVYRIKQMAHWTDGNWGYLEVLPKMPLLDYPLFVSDASLLDSLK